MKRNCKNCGRFMKGKRLIAFLSSGKIKQLVHFTCSHCEWQTYKEIEI